MTETAPLITESPLVHCIAPSISSTFCANALLAIGARPIMAEAPQETVQITAGADALALSLAMPNESKRNAMIESAKAATDETIPVSLDLAGYGASTYRQDIARDILNACTPAIIKGNVTELRRFLGLEAPFRGVDGMEQSEAQKEELIEAGVRYAKESGSVLIATGRDDLILHKSGVSIVHNGTPALSRITGTGCVLNVLCAAFLSRTDPKNAALLALLSLNLAAEKAEARQREENRPGCGSFQVLLLDELSMLTRQDLAEGACVSERAGTD